MQKGKIMPKKNAGYIHT